MRLLCCILLFTGIVGCDTKWWTERKRIGQLLDGYDPIGRPVWIASDPVKVTLDVVLQQVVDLDEKNQVLLTSLLIQLKWCDEILSKRIQGFRGCSNKSHEVAERVNQSWKENLVKHDDDNDDDEVGFVLPADRIWTPDLYVYNNAADGNNGMLRVDESRLRVTKHGDVIWNLPVTVQSLCNVDVLYFPFDHQICDIRMGSWMYDKAQLELRMAKANELDSILNGMMENVELGIPEAKFILNDRITADGLRFSQLTLRIHIERRALFYGYTVIAPSILLCVLTIFSFWLPSGNAKKIDIGLTVFLFLYFLQVLIAENTPESNSTPLIGTFLTMVMTLNSLSLISATCVLYLHGQSKQNPCPAPPTILWTIASQVLGKITGTPYNKEQEKLYAALHTKPNSPANSLLPEPDEFKQQKLQSSHVQVVHWLYIATVTDRFLFLIYALATVACVFIFFVYAPISYDVKI